jgi:hypothetical protein
LRWAEIDVVRRTATLVDDSKTGRTASRPDAASGRSRMRHATCCAGCPHVGRAGLSSDARRRRNDAAFQEILAAHRQAGRFAGRCDAACAAAFLRLARCRPLLQRADGRRPSRTQRPFGHQPLSPRRRRGVARSGRHGGKSHGQIDGRGKTGSRRGAVTDEAMRQ